MRFMMRRILAEGRAEGRRPLQSLVRRLFIASEAILFASLFSGYALLRAGSSEWPGPIGGFPWLETLLLVGASAAFGSKRSQLVVCNSLGLTFVVIKVLNDLSLINRGITPSTNLMWACWFTLTGVHALHVLGGAAFTGWLAGPSFRMAADDRDRWLARIEATRRYWLFVDLVWLFIVAGQVAG
jgi:cytochrome c oxidase subunit 3